MVHRWVGAALALGVAGAMGALGPGSFAVSSPTPVAPLQVSPRYGPGGSVVTATLTGCPGSTAAFRWEGHDDEPWGDPVDEPDGSVRATTTVPLSFEPGTYDVVTECNYIDRVDPFRATFTVTKDESVPRLSLVPTEGAVDEVVTATVTGYQCAGAVDFLWHGEILAGSAQPAADGTATAPIRVPRGFAEGRHDVLAQCRADGFRWPPADFLVIGGGGHGDGETPTLTLDPSRLRAGEELTATAAGYACAGDIVFQWSGGHDAARATPDKSGSATAVATVPADFAPGDHEVRAICEADGHVWPAASFTVVGETVPTGSFWDRWPGVPLLILLGILAVASLPWLHFRHGPRWARLHVRAAQGEAAYTGLDTSQSPTDRQTRDVTIRIRPHPDSGEQTFREVDP